MRTDFSINAGQLKDIFPDSRLKPDKQAIFRSIALEDVDALFDMDPYYSRNLYKGCVNGKYVYIIGAFHKGIPVGYIATNLENRLLVLNRVFVKDTCRDKHGLGTALLLVFFCLAVYLKAKEVSFFGMLPRVHDMLRNFGLKDVPNILALEEAISRFRTKGIDLSKHGASP